MVKKTIIDSKYNFFKMKKIQIVTATKRLVLVVKMCAERAELLCCFFFTPVKFDFYAAFI